MPPEKQKPFRVLSIDGGGMRGLYASTYIETLSRRYHKDEIRDVGAAFDLIVGTSTGGIIACGLAAGIPIDRISSLYEKHGKTIFPRPTPNISSRITTAWNFLCWEKDRDDWAIKGRDSLKSELTEVFKDQTIESIWSNRKIALCIPTTNMSQDQPWVFKTPHLKGKTRDNKYTLIDVCLATAAAPIFFPLAVTDIPDADNKYNVFSDGGLWANNPVMIGMTEALEIAGPKQPIEIISIGTCATKMGKTISKSEANWGLLKWKGGTEIVSASLGAQSYGYGFIAQQLSKHLDRPCTVVRLPNSPPSPEQAALIGLDKASENSCKAMTDLGRNDAEALHGRLTRGDKNLQIVQDIFTSLCEFS